MHRSTLQNLSKNLKGKAHLEDLVVDVMIICVMELTIKKMNAYWIPLAQDRDQCRVLVKNVMYEDCYLLGCSTV
jgi:hypothetical protein